MPGLCRGLRFTEKELRPSEERENPAKEGRPQPC